MVEITHSPSSKPQARSLDFPEAIRELRDGRRITRSEWGDVEIYGHLNGEFLSLHKADGKNYKWIVNDGDLLANDWKVLPK
jgi:hypothetical protein